MMHEFLARETFFRIINFSQELITGVMLLMKPIKGVKK